MKTERSYPQLCITAKGSRHVKSGHPWIYEEEVCTEHSGLENGCIVDAVTAGGSYLGSGLLSRNSKIRIRILSNNANDRFEEAFWRRRLEYAWQYRKSVMPDDLSCCRIVFGEADGLPGLTVDRFSDILVAQCLSYGMDRRKELIYPLLLEILQKDGQTVSALYERNDSPLREREGLQQGKGWFTAARDPVTEITENGVRYLVDVENGQKTGFFLDQKYNRLAVAKLARGKRVLDCFTHTGSFALNAAKGGARAVTAVDVSASAVAMAEENARRNGLQENMEFVTADVFDLLPKLAESHAEPYDLIILDPPAFTKSRKTADRAESGYKEINYRAMKLLPRGGYLATASCSHFMPSPRFEEMLRAAAADAGRSLRLIEARGPAPDHPVLWNVPETEYLKFYLLQVV